MIKNMFVRFTVTLVAILSFWGISTQSLAFDIELPPGVACDFPLGINIGVPEHRVMKTFYDKEGNPVRFLQAGEGNLLEFGNLDSGSTISLKTGGSVAQIIPNSDGSETWINTGHNVVVFFPSDVPAGPATTLYIGKLVFRLNPSENMIDGIESFSGKSTDICAVLEG